ncbi:MAG: hypothetical protein WC455_21030 [Dehalococcoidia bacterium]|jgi:hypothetical protein
MAKKQAPVILESLGIEKVKAGLTVKEGKVIATVTLDVDMSAEQVTTLMNAKAQRPLTLSIYSPQLEFGENVHEAAD